LVVTDSRTRSLLFVLAALLLVRFGVVPWLEHQSETRDALEVLSRRVERSTLVLNNQDLIVNTEKTLAKAASAARARFKAYPDAAAFKLESQPAIEQLAAANSVTLVSFSWMLDGEVPDSSLRFARARIQFSGAPRALAGLHADLDGQFPALNTRELSLNIPRGIGVDLENAPATLNVMADLYFLDARAVKSESTP
jgi:hypothetical protein